ncbi:MAG: hypothetical protein M0Z59_06250 [Nitrospiraceae bacterium]|nr:hypothetical protein [Nitrospiraceae bacterium]
MKKRFRVLMWFALLGAIAIALAACGGSGGSSGAATGAVVNGIVADGYVSNATVTVYSDKGLTNVIGSGSTDQNGYFSFHLTVSPVPSPVYIKAEGGIDKDTGMPAATMVFAGTFTAGGINITPITDTVYHYSLAMGLDAAMAKVSGQLGISNADLYGNPVTNAAVSTAMANVVSSGTGAATLPNGSYRLVAIHFSDSDVMRHTYSSITGITNTAAPGHQAATVIDITVSNGAVTGTVAGSATATVSGRVRGSAVVLSIIDGTDTTRVAGTIGLLGGITGTFLDYDSDPSSLKLTKGVFAASAVPSGVTQAGLYAAAGSLYTGPRNFIAKGDFGEHGLHWGQTNAIIVNGATGAITNGDIPNLYQDAGSRMAAVAGFRGKVAVAGSMHLTLNQGRIVTAGGAPTSIAIMEYDLGGGDELYVVQPAGCRGGIYITTDGTGLTQGVGDATFTKPGGIASLQGSYDIEVASVGPWAIGQQRAGVIANAVQAVGTANFGSPSGGFYVSGNGFGMSNGTELGVTTGDVIAMKKDDDNVWNGQDEEHLRLVNVFETGAFEGNEVQNSNSMGNASMVNGASGDAIGNFPSAFVGMATPHSSTPPSFAGTMNFLSRALYSSASYAYSYYTWGSITINGTSATLSSTDNETPPSSGTIAATAENRNGVYHIYGHAPAGPGYIDIFWPVGGRKAVYVYSESGIVVEVGEAFITQ